MEEVSVLQAVADSCGSGVHVEKYADTSSGSSQLRINTQEASDRGAFGVPRSVVRAFGVPGQWNDVGCSNLPFLSFYIADQLFWGVDRMFMVERMLGVKEANQERLIPPPYRAGTAGLLSFYFDYSSPWSYLASMRLKEVIEEVRPVQVKVEYVPILVGALFKKIGIPIVRQYTSLLPSSPFFFSLSGSYEIDH